ncbi:MAG: Mannosylfructose-phosphate synthase, partial [Frondihabitans sp.]|nr:Mannosylfructose-phosphate synthase [Frondihabitans sp.]
MARPKNDLRLMWWLYADTPVTTEKRDSPAERLQATLSWRVTSPLRQAKAVQKVAAAQFRGIDPDKTRPLVDPDDDYADELKGLTRQDVLRQRVLEVAPHILGAPVTAALQSGSVTELIEAVLDSIDLNDLSQQWLLFTAVAATMPDGDTLRAFSRDLASAPRDQRLRVVFDHTGPLLTKNSGHFRLVDVVTDQPVVDVDFCARHGFTSGVQRVVRETFKRWNQTDPFTLVAWTQDASTMRRVSPRERARVVAWSPDNRGDRPLFFADGSAKLVVPWKTAVVLPEVTPERYSAELACLVEHSGNATIAIGYDAIPVVNGAYVSRDDSIQFVHYLSILKHVDVILAISESAGAEFEGFSRALGAQGLPGPRVEVLSLPSEPSVTADAAEVKHPGKPVVVSVGSHEPRKNQIAIAYAAELLWRRGREFGLVLIGGSGPVWYTDLDDKINELSISGYPITILRGVTDRELATAYSNARFTVFTSLHEGYGLPVTESLAAGTPVITSNYGSTSEIARDGGCVMVDPTDIEAIAAAMELLLTDDAALSDLERQIADRPVTTWDAY